MSIIYSFTILSPKCQKPNQVDKGLKLVNRLNVKTLSGTWLMRLELLVSINPKPFNRKSLRKNSKVKFEKLSVVILWLESQIADTADKEQDHSMN